MKLELAVISLGFLVLLFSLYLYVKPNAPPDITITEYTTTTSADTSTTFEWIRSTTTTLWVYVTKPTFPDWLTTTLPKATTTTTTLVPPSCLNEMLDPDEVYVDCGLQCGNCAILNLTGSWIRYSNENLWLKFDGADRIQGGPCTRGSKTDPWGRSTELPYPCFNNVYYVTIKTTEINPDLRTLQLEEASHVDNFELMLVEDYNSSLLAYVKKDYNTLTLTPRYVVMSLGGRDCNHNQTGFCRRQWNDYSFRLIEREAKRARIEVTLPSGKKTEIWLTEGETTVVDGVRIGLLYAYEKGGYCSIYLMKA